MDDGRIPNNVLYGDLATGSRPTGRPPDLQDGYKDVCKGDQRAGGVDPADLETASSDRVSWRSTEKAGIEEAELRRETRWEERPFRRQQRLAGRPARLPVATAADPASQGLDCTVTAGFATLPQTNPGRNYHSLPRLTDANNEPPLTKKVSLVYTWNKNTTSLFYHFHFRNNPFFN